MEQNFLNAYDKSIAKILLAIKVFITIFFNYESERTFLKAFLPFNKEGRCY